jgi:hypothetical protein
MRFLRSWLCAVIVACLLVPRASAQPALDTDALKTIEDQVTEIRGLQPRSPTDLRLLDNTSLNSYLADEFARNYLPNERESDQKELAILGLIQPTDDLVQIQLAMLKDQVIGVYDTDTRSLFVVSDQGSFGPAARIAYAHEFNHSLQDQYYGLRKIAPRHTDNNDRSLAAHALIEGDAILLQSLWALKNMSQDDLAEVIHASSSGPDDTLSRVPLILRTELLFPYLEGLNFVRQAYRQAGNSYAGVDALFNSPPESTAQVLHIERYRNQVHPVDVQLGDLATVLGPQWRKVGGGVLGELDTRVLLEQWGAGQTEAHRVAASWSGDRWQLVEQNGRDAVAFKSVWASPAAASDFFTAYTSGLRTRFSAAEVQESSSTRQALTTPEAATDVRLQDNSVLVVIAFDRQAADAVVAAATFSAA